jgi:hypothetical protein
MTKRWITSEDDPGNPVIAMKLSTESIVAAVVAVTFALLTLGAIGREQGASGNSLANVPDLNQVAVIKFNSSGGTRLLAQH